MINNLDKDSKKPNCYSLSISKADFKDLFWQKQSLFIMTFIFNNFFQNKKTQHPTFIMLVEPAYISGK